jgi:hypothetical protein
MDDEAGESLEHRPPTLPLATLRSASRIAYTAPVVWEAIFLLLILKIPVIYLACVVWYAIKNEPAPPEPLEGALVTEPRDPGPKPGWRFLRRADRRRLPRPGPHGSPARGRRRVAIPASWQAGGWKAPE